MQLPFHDRRPKPLQPDPTRAMWLGELVVDPVAISARYRGKLLTLCLQEFRLLALFIANPDRLFTRAELIENMGKAQGLISERTVDAWTGRLRRALRAQGVPDPLRTVRAQGYVMDTEKSCEEALRA